MDQKKFLKDSLKAFEDLAETDDESDIPVTEKKTKEEIQKE